MHSIKDKTKAKRGSTQTNPVLKKLRQKDCSRQPGIHSKTLFKKKKKSKSTDPPTHPMSLGVDYCRKGHASCTGSLELCAKHTG